MLMQLLGAFAEFERLAGAARLVVAGRGRQAGKG
jgi:hypothetical protein